MPKSPNIAGFTQAALSFHKIALDVPLQAAESTSASPWASHSFIEVSMTDSTASSDTSLGS
jgi:hypothetical protein